MEKTRNNILRITLSILGALVFFFPIYTVAIGGFKTNGQLLADPFGLPNPFTSEAYRVVLLSGSQFWGFLFNSVVISGFTILLTLAASMLAATGLSRIEFKGRGFLFNFFIMGMLFPITVAVLPLYLQLRGFGLIGTRLGVILSQAAFSLPLAIFIFTGFFREVPKDLQDAVSIDGGGLLTFAWRVLLPLSTPVISTVTIITLIQSWNQFLLPLLVLDDASTFTIPLGVMQFQGQYTTGWNRIMAFISIALLPMAMLYIFLQKYVVAGLTAGAVKG
ncbi:carbohydrate ABC transporter permease [Spirochaeta lutea]|uniref:Thiamine ABC transporter ATP-binding protein n=1 Tax=Spirochaeta lutea TaxID=1480694 RepID=A0A098QTT6_9SPIO|nr:carbohydrate ABC transporter permease [Spirochaeta lutea]KGE70986.1 thiamine ABC transporter ATP-binding protein [Spirochaeta lutea]